MTVAEILQWTNALVVPALGYIIMLERRITRMQGQIDMLLQILRREK